MQGDKIGEESGKVTSQRVLPNPGGGPKMEISFQATGTILGVPHSSTFTYESVVRPDGTVYGEGQGIAMGKEGEQATVVGHGVGRFNKDASVSYRGAAYYQTESPKWLRMNSVAAIFEYEVGAEGYVRGQSWEWK